MDDFGTSHAAFSQQLFGGDDVMQQFPDFRDQGFEGQTSNPTRESQHEQRSSSQGSQSSGPFFVDDILSQGGRNHLRILDPGLAPGTYWFKYSGTKVTKVVRKIMQGVLKPGNTTFKSMDQSEKDIWFRTFARHFNWEPANTPLVSQAFEEVAAKNMSSNLYTWKKGKEKKGKPKHVSEEVWKEFLTYWNKEKTQWKAAIQKRNGTSERKKNGRVIGRAIHNSGAMSFLTRHRLMTEKAGGVPPNNLQFLEAAYTNKKTGEVQDPIMREVLVTVKSKVSPSQESGADSSATPQMSNEEINNIVMETLPLGSSGRVYGLGDVAEKSSITEAAYHSQRVLQEKYDALQQKQQETEAKQKETEAKLKEQETNMANMASTLVMLQEQLKKLTEKGVSE